MLQAGATASLWFAIFTAPLCFWVAWSDMAHMKIPNKAVTAMFVVFAVLGLIFLPLAEFGWRWLHLVVVLLIGFVMNMIRLVGAGDAKFAAVMAPFIALGDLSTFILLFAVIMLAAFVSHRAMRAFAPFRNAVPDWASWQRKDFPMGLALAGSLTAYLIMAARYGS